MKIGFISLGCCKNLVDSEQIMGLLKASGHQIIPDAKQAEAIIINNVDRQSIHFTDTITLHFEYLEGIASHFAASDDLLSKKRLILSWKWLNIKNIIVKN